MRLIAVAALGLSLAAAVARASTVAVSSTVSAGTTLSVAGTGSPTFALTLNGDDQVASYVLPLQVVDARGLSAGGGWNLTLTSTQFADVAGRTFPSNASTITGATAACNATSTCALPTNGVAYPLALPAGSSPPTAVKAFNAASPTGRGRIDIAANVSVAVPANVIAGTYTSTVTVSIVAGP